MQDFLGSFTPELLAFLACILFIAGAVRGFSGFGAAMIFMPVATSVVYPPTAAASFLFLDFFIGLPLVFRALRLCDWHTVLPAVIASVIFVHVGAWFLANTDVLLLRWLIFAIVTGVLLLLMSGWRYHGRPSIPVSLGIGATSGILGGVSQVSGPPVVAFWLSSAKEPAIVRANLIVYFTLASIGTIFAFALNGFFTTEVARLDHCRHSDLCPGDLSGLARFRQGRPEILPGHRLRIDRARRGHQHAAPRRHPAVKQKSRAEALPSNSSALNRLRRARPWSRRRCRSSNRRSGRRHRLRACRSASSGSGPCPHRPGSGSAASR